MMRTAFSQLVGAVTVFSLSACATLPQREATAFKTIAKADADAFGKATAADLASRSEAAIIQLPSTGLGITTTRCTGDLPTTAVCDVMLTGPGAPPLSLVEGAPKTRKLIASIAAYGAAMADLAEAKDLAAAKANLDAAGTAIESLATLTGVAAPAAGIIKAATALGKGKLTEARRKALLEAALAADPAVRQVSANLAEIATQVRGNILDGTSTRINRYEIQFGRATKTWLELQRQQQELPKDAAGDDERERLRVLMNQEQTLRVDAGNALVRTAADVRLARGMRTDFSGLTKAHLALIEALRTKSVGLTPAFEGINSFLDAVSSAKGE
jgi:hypothetical protein